MKAIVTKTDGTKIEFEGTPEEFNQLNLVPGFTITTNQPCFTPHCPDPSKHWGQPEFIGSNITWFPYTSSITYGRNY